MTFGLQYMQTASYRVHTDQCMVCCGMMHKRLNAFMWQTCVKLVQASKTQEQIVVRDVYPCNIPHLEGYSSEMDSQLPS